MKVSFVYNYFFPSLADISITIIFPSLADISITIVFPSLADISITIRPFKVCVTWS